jgi:hypothetical protein
MLRVKLGNSYSVRPVKILWTLGYIILILALRLMAADLSSSVTVGLFAAGHNSSSHMKSLLAALGTLLRHWKLGGSDSTFNLLTNFYTALNPAPSST